MPLLEHAQELAAGGPAGAHVEMLESEVRALGVAQEDPPLERQALAGGVGDGVAQPGVLQEGCVGEGVAAVQHDFFGRPLRSRARKCPWLTRPPAPMSFRPGQTRMVCGMLVVVGPVPVYSIVTASGGARRRLSRVLILMRWAWEMTRLTSGSPSRGNPFSGRVERLGQGLLPGFVDPEPGQEAKNARVAPHVLGELVVPAVGEVVEQLAVLELALHRSAREVVHDRGELAEVAEQQEVDFAVHGDAGDIVPQPGVELRDFLRHQPVDVAVPVPNGAPRRSGRPSPPACRSFCTEEWVFVMIFTL